MDKKDVNFSIIRSFSLTAQTMDLVCGYTLLGASKRDVLETVSRSFDQLQEKLKDPELIRKAEEAL